MWTMQNEAIEKRLSRRRALGLLGGAVGGLTLAACNGGGRTDDGSSSGSSSSSSSSSGSSSGSASSSSSGGSAASCTLTPEGEVGPYFTDDSASGYNRSDIRSNIDGSSTQSGIPLTLHLYVYDFDNNCAAMAGVQVDIWHCNASGVYSNESVESTLGQSWLRGYQITDASGAVTFKTIVPGWYQGRTTHIHLRLRSSYNSSASLSDGSNTTQLFFPQALVDSIDTTVAPYSAEGRNSTTNAGDRVYTEQTEGRMEMTLSGDSANGYVASVIIGLPVTAA
jgi:protocatechuate 3,4-dioxygenase beta subunit